MAMNFPSISMGSMVNHGPGPLFLHGRHLRICLNDLFYGHGRKIMQGHMAFESGIVPWRCEGLVGFNSTK